MKALKTISKNKLKIINKDKPVAKGEDVLLKVKACGVCGTDHHIYNGQYNEKFPIVMGHEISGVIEQIGENVTNLKIGDKVAVDPNIYCGKCQYCFEGKVNFCENLEAIGVTRNGGFAEYLVAPSTNTYKLPNEFSFVNGALVEPISCVLHGLEQVEIKENDNVIIFGAGLIGLIMAKIIEEYHSKNIIFSEIEKYRIKKAKEFGFEVIDSDMLKNKKYDVIIDATGNIKAIEEALNLTKKMSRILLFGVSNKKDQVKISPYDIYEKEINIIGSFLNPFTSKKAVDILENKNIDFEDLVDKKLKLDQLNEIFTNSSNEYVKAMFVD